MNLKVKITEKKNYAIWAIFFVQVGAEQARLTISKSVHNYYLKEWFI